MRNTVAVIFGLVLTASIALPAKGVTTKIRITGPTLTTPVEITDPQVLSGFGVWDWARPGHDGFIVSYVNMSSVAPPKQWPRYDVAFYAGTDKPVYVVAYQFSPSTQQGYVYIPPTRLNRSTIGRDGMEDWWLPASRAWERVARPLIAKTK